MNEEAPSCPHCGEVRQVEPITVRLWYCNTCGRAFAVLLK